MLIKDDGVLVASATAPILVVSVEVFTDTEVYWTFSDVVPITGNVPQLQMRNGVLLSPVSCDNNLPSQIHAVYTGGMLDADLWQIVTDPVNIIPHARITIPQSGTPH